MIRFQKSYGAKVWRVTGPLNEVKVGPAIAVRRNGTPVKVKIRSLGQPFSDDKGGIMINGYIHKRAKKETLWHKQACSCCGDPGGVVVAYEALGPKGYICLECARLPRSKLFFKGAVT